MPSTAAEQEAIAHELIAEGHRKLAELARSRGDTGAKSYSTVQGCWPPRCRTRRTARERIRAVPGHTREGAGRACVWSVSTSAYHKHYAGRAPLQLVPASPVLDDAALAAAALEAIGTRPTRRAS